MNEIEFEEHRKNFRHLMAEKSLAEIRAMRRTFEKLDSMFGYQRLYLIDDLRLMENYKTKSQSMNEEFERMMQGLNDEF